MTTYYEHKDTHQIFKYLAKDEQDNTTLKNIVANNGDICVDEPLLTKYFIKIDGLLALHKAINYTVEYFNTINIPNINLNELDQRITSIYKTIIQQYTDLNVYSKINGDLLEIDYYIKSFDGNYNKYTIKRSIK